MQAVARTTRMLRQCGPLTASQLAVEFTTLRSKSSAKGEMGEGSLCLSSLASLSAEYVTSLKEMELDCESVSVCLSPHLQVHGDRTVGVGSQSQQTTR